MWRSLALQLWVSICLIIFKTGFPLTPCFLILLHPPGIINQRRIRNAYIYLPLPRKNSSYLINERRRVELRRHLTLRAHEERGSAPVKTPGPRGNTRGTRVPCSGRTSLENLLAGTCETLLHRLDRFRDVAAERMRSTFSSHHSLLASAVAANFSGSASGATTGL